MDACDVTRGAGGPSEVKVNRETPWRRAVDVAVFSLLCNAILFHDEVNASAGRRIIIYARLDVDVCGDMTFRVSWFEFEFMCGGGRTNTKTWNAVNGMSTMEVLR